MTKTAPDAETGSAAIDLTQLDQEAIDWIRWQTASSGHMAFRDQNLTPPDLEQFVSYLGELVFTPGERPLTGCQYVFEVTNRFRTTKPKSVFHSDTSYVGNPPSFTVLAAVEVPQCGGETLIIDQYATARCAPPDLVELVEGLELLHIPTRVADLDDAGAGVWHPVSRIHPLTQRTALFLSARERLAGARRHGTVYPDAEGDQLIDRIHNHATTAVAPYVHKWAPGDVLIVDNRCTLHAADHLEVVGHRTLHPGLGMARGGRVPLTERLEVVLV